MGKKSKTYDIQNVEYHKARVLDLCSRLEEELELGWIEITHQFHEGSYEDHVQSDEYGTTTATTVNRWQYRMARIQWFLNSVAVTSDEDLERVAIHEYVHVLMGPLSAHLKSGDHVTACEELATENIFRAIQAARKARNA